MRRVKQYIIGCLYSLFGIMTISIMCAICFLFSGCKSVEYVPVPEYHHDSIYITKVQHDSIYKRDSVYVKEYAKGDTVFVEKTKWHTQYKEKLVHDTLYAEKADSVPIPYPVEKKLTKWQQAKIDWGGKAIFVLCIVIFIIIWLIVRRCSKALGQKLF